MAHITDPRVTHPSLSTVADVRAWFDAIHAAGVSFHPDDRFQNTVEQGTGEPTFDTRDAVNMDVAMRSAHAICAQAGEDIYAVGIASLRDHEIRQEP